MSEENSLLKRVLESWRKSREESERFDIASSTELLALIRDEMQLVDKTSSKRRTLEWYHGAVKSLLEDAVRTRFLKSLLVSFRRLEKMANQDTNSLSRFSVETPEEIDLRLLASYPLKDVKDKKVLVIVLHDIDRFVWENGNEYGPYPAGCLVNIPYYVAKLLEERKVAEEIFIT